MSTRHQRIEAFALNVALRPFKARKGRGPGRMSAEKRDRLAALAMMVEREASTLNGQKVVHIPARLISEIRKELRT